MKTFLTITRQLGVVLAAAGLGTVTYLFFVVYLPIISDPSSAIGPSLRRSVFTDALPFSIVCVALLLPFGRITSLPAWRGAFIFLCVTAALLITKSYLKAFMSIHPSVPLVGTTLTALIIASQVCVIAIQRRRSTSKIAQGGSAHI